jgi:hypothetical protein
MRNVITVAVDAKGNRKEIFGTEDSEHRQREYFQASKHGELPKGVVRIEQWQRIKVTTGIDKAARKKRLEEEAESIKNGEKRAAALDVLAQTTEPAKTPEPDKAPESPERKGEGEGEPNKEG